MRINSINNYSYTNRGIKVKNSLSNNHTNALSFQGKRTFTKLLGGMFGATGTVGAIGGSLIMSGGILLPIVLLYGGASAVAGAVLGHMIDSPDNKKSENEEKNIES